MLRADGWSEVADKRWRGWRLTRLLCGLALLSSQAALAAEPLRRFLTEPFPPYTFADEAGRAAGPMADVLREACEQLGWRCSIEVLPWRRALNEAQRGEAHGLFTVSDTPERRAYFHVSVPVVDARYALFARAGEDFVYRGRPEQLAGRTVAAYGPSGTLLALEELAQAEPSLRVETEPDNLTVLRKLVAGRYGPEGLALINEGVALHLIRERGVGGLQAAGVVKQFAYSFGLARSRVSLKEFQAFNATLVRLCRSGRSAALIKPHAVPASPCAKAS